MKVLLSAYGCSPIQGSEPGVGWRWACELSEDHDVTVLTHPFFEEEIKRVISISPKNIRFVYYEVPRLKKRRRKGELNSRWYYYLWQWCASGRAKQLVRERKFDVVHHLTWGNFRLPSFMWRTGVPFVFGPVGGGETAPLRLYAGLPLRERIVEYLRHAWVWVAKYDPLVRLCLRRAKLVVCKTKQTALSLPARSPGRCLVALEVGAEAQTMEDRNPMPSGGKVVQLLYVGRLIGLKGVHFLIDAVNILRNKGIPIRLDIVGEGPLRGFLSKKVAALGLGHEIQFRGSVKFSEIQSVYRDADYFVFPSLHDSSGTVILEALSAGVPVVCLDLGGPAEIVDSTCGEVVDTEGLTVAQLSARIANVIERLNSLDTDARAALKLGALDRAQSLSWRGQVGRVYRAVEQHVL